MSVVIDIYYTQLILGIVFILFFGDLMVSSYIGR